MRNELRIEIKNARTSNEFKTKCCNYAKEKNLDQNSFTNKNENNDWLFSSTINNINSICFSGNGAISCAKILAI